MKPPPISSRQEKESEKKRFLEKQKQMEFEKMKKELKESQEQKVRIKKILEEEKKERLERRKILSNISKQTKMSSPNPSNQDQSTLNRNNMPNECILQIRLPSGNLIKLEMKPTDTVEHVHKIICNHYIHDPSFLLIIPFPRKEFRSNMLHQTLLEADLVPRGSLTVQMIADKGVIRKGISFTDEDIDPDEMSYEQLVELTETIGTGSGISSEKKNKIPTRIFEPEKEEPKQCLICQYEFEKGEVLRKMDCHHEFHFECLDQWLNNSNSCPICKLEVL